MVTRSTYQLDAMFVVMCRTLLTLVVLAAQWAAGPLPQPAHAAPVAQAAVCDPVTQTQIPTSECQALMALYDATNGPGWANSVRNDKPWMTNTPCSWYGVTCLPSSVVSSTVTTISLSGNGLTGEIPARMGTLPVFGSLPNLVQLSLSDNALTGTLAGKFVNLPKLELLRLDNTFDKIGNQLTGPIPIEIGDLTSLRFLWLWGNRLTGGLPVELGKLTKLEQLRVQSNLLDGSIEFTPTELVNLSVIDASRNQLTGTLPVFGSMPSLTVVSLADNALTGTLVGKFINLPKLESLDLGNATGQGHNQLTGPIPIEIGDLTSLRFLWLWGNRLTGGLPVELGKLTKLEQLRVQSNLLDGSIEFTPTELVNLSVIDASRNQLTGTLPVFGSMPSLTVVSLADNALTGTLVGKFINLPKLESLDLGNATGQGHNQLTGPIPIEIGDLTSLRFLWLFNNRLTGGLPVELGKLTRLEELRVQSNLLDGSIEFTPTKLVSLTVLYAGRNQLTGTLPIFADMPSLTGLDLNDNAFTGTLSGKFINLPKLEGLWLGNATAQGNNRFSGPIPPEIGDLAGLRVLWLFGNRLTGGLPVELGKLTKLEELRVQSNLLNGSIEFTPTKLVSLTVLYAGRNQLTGTLPIFADMPSLTGLDLNDNAFTGTLSGKFVNLPKLQSLHLGNATAQGRNQFPGPIPPEMGTLISLTALDLYNIKLAGDLPIELGNLTNLEDLRLQDNLLTGNLPTWLEKLTGLKVLYLQNNLFNGTILFDPSKLTNLETFYASRNQITGTVPVFANMPNLINMSLADNALTGTLAGKFVNLPKLQYLHLGNDTNLGKNQLTGPIPLEIGTLISLTTLYLNSNKLTGSLPVELGKLTQLTDLRLQGNSLSGPIPGSLGNLSGLQILYLFSNMLTGTLPSEIGNLTLMRNLRLDYNALEGTVPPSFANIGSVTRVMTPSIVSAYSANYNNLSTDVVPGVNYVLRRYNPLRATTPWQATQVQPPTHVQARQIGSDLLVTWDLLTAQTPTSYQVQCDGPQTQTFVTPNGQTSSAPFPAPAQGTYTCMVRAFVKAQPGAGQKNDLLSAPSIAVVVTISAPPLNKVFVTTAAGQPVIGASVVVSRAGSVVGTGLSVSHNGEVAFNQPVQLGDALIAISQTTTLSTTAVLATPKGQHGNKAGRAYVTSIDITTQQGALPYTLTTTGTHTLTVKSTEPLLTFDLVASMQWSTFDDDPAKRYAVLRELARAFAKASDHLYAVSEGRLALGTVKIYDDGQYWQDADIHVFATTSLIPNAEVSGTKRSDAYMSIRRGWDRKQNDVALDTEPGDGYKMLVHELGHYLLGLRDSYEGTSTVMCVTLMAWPYDGPESAIFSMQGVAPWLPGSDEAKRCVNTEQWKSLGMSDWETIVKNYGDAAGGGTGLTVPTRHITETLIASPLSAATVITYPSGRQIQAVPVRLLTLAVTRPNSVGQPLNATIVRPNGQVIDLGPVDKSGNITITVPLEASDQLLLATPDGASSQLLSAAQLSGTVSITVSDALANPTIDVRPFEDARGITVTVGNVTALDGADTLSATVTEPGEEFFTAPFTLTRQADVYVGAVSFGSRAIKQGDVRVVARTLGGAPVLVTSNFTTNGDITSHMDRRVPRSPDGKFEMRFPPEATQIPTSTVFIISPIRISGTVTATNAVRSLAVQSPLTTDAPGAADPYLAPPSDLQQVGSLYNIRASGGLISIQQQMSVTLFYDPATLGNLSETQITIYYLDEQTRQWQPLTTTLNLRSTVETHSVSASNNRFGIYGLFIKTRYRLQAGSDGPQQNEFVYAPKTAEPLMTALQAYSKGDDCSGKYTELYSVDPRNPTNPWRKYLVSADPPYLNTLSTLEPGHAYQIVMKPNTSCTLDFTPDKPVTVPPATSNPLALPILPATVYGPALPGATEVIGSCTDDPTKQVRVDTVIDPGTGARVFNIDLPLTTRDAMATCTVEVKALNKSIRKEVSVQSGTRVPKDMSKEDPKPETPTPTPTATATPTPMTPTVVPTTVTPVPTTPAPPKHKTWFPFVAAQSTPVPSR